MKTTNFRNLTLIVALAVSGGCGGSTSTTAPTDGAETLAETTNETGASATGSEASFTALPGSSPARVTFLEFGNQTRLFLGTSNGMLADVNVMGRKSSASRVSTKGAAVKAVSPDGSLAILDSQPPAAVNTGGELILNMNAVTAMEDAAFAKDTFTLYVSSSDGTIRLWGQAHSFEEPQNTEKMEDYLNRQASDFFVKVDPLSGPLHSTADGYLVFADQEGVVSRWSMRSPSSAKRIMKLDGRAKSLSTSGNEVVSTSVNGSLKVGRLEPASYLPWSREEKADYAATSNFYPGKFVQLSSGALRARQIEDGADEWTAELPSGAPCGLAVSGDGSVVAACIDNRIALFNTRDGSLDSIAWLEGETLKWQAANGDTIAK